MRLPCGYTERRLRARERLGVVLVARAVRLQRRLRDGGTVATRLRHRRALERTTAEMRRFDIRFTNEFIKVDR